MSVPVATSAYARLRGAALPDPAAWCSRTPANPLHALSLTLARAERVIRWAATDPELAGRDVVAAHADSVRLAQRRLRAAVTPTSAPTAAATPAPASPREFAAVARGLEQLAQAYLRIDVDAAGPSSGSHPGGTGLVALSELVRDEIRSGAQQLGLELEQPV